MSGTIEVFAGDVNDVVGHVFARFIGELSAPNVEPVTLEGTLRGPFCETSRTLPAEIKFRDLSRTQPGLAEAIVPDPCVWSPELPHLYHAHIEARHGERVVAEYRGMIGLRQTR